MVRFLRNVTVAKIAGKDSALLQVSSDERARVWRIAELFSEEDLARHLQIMLRTHAELGYRQEQRFHLELGLLKMAHAQRLLPIEQLLSDAALPVSGPARTAPRPGISIAASADTRFSQPSQPARSNSVSPFAADSARKGTPKAEASGEPAAFADKSVHSTQATTNANVVIMGSAALAVEDLAPAQEPQPVPRELRADASADSLRDAVLGALSNQQMLVSMLGSAEWALNGNVLTAKVAASSTMIEMTFTNDARRVASAAASGVAGRPIKVVAEPGGVAQTAPAPRKASNGSARSRAEQDPIVQRMQEKFGAEIRTVIDYREKDNA
jgi:DNA polymerase-3 subunit gamma/tau